MTKPYKLLREKMTEKSRNAAAVKTEKMLKIIKSIKKLSKPKHIPRMPTNSGVFRLNPKTNALFANEYPEL